MIKTIKVKKQMRLDELIEYVRDNRVREKTFKTNEHGNTLTNTLKVDEDGLIETYFPNMHLNNSFTVEVEEEITEDTKFETLLEINNAGELYHYKNTTISSMSGASSKYFHAIIDGKLQLIWEAK